MSQGPTRRVREARNVGEHPGNALATSAACHCSATWSVSRRVVPADPPPRHGFCREAAANDRWASNGVVHHQEVVALSVSVALEWASNRVAA